MSRPPVIDAFFDEATCTVSYLVSDPETGRAAVIDPVLDYDHRAGVLSTTSADWIMSQAAEKQLRIDWVLETHVHADHLTAAPHVKSRTDAKTVIGEQVRAVQKAFAAFFKLRDVSGEGAEFDRLVGDGDKLPLGSLQIEVMHLPGHMPANVAYKIGEGAFVGETIFMPDYGTARTDFPGGDAVQLYRSLRHLLALPPETRLFLGHDYKAPGRNRYAWECTVAEQRKRNVHIREGISEADFVAMRRRRDETLPMPDLFMPALQVNIRGGRLPEPDTNGVSYLRIPVTLS